MQARLARLHGRLDLRIRRLRSRWWPSWRHEPDVVPWLDQPDALQRLRAARLCEGERVLLEQWVRDGYFVVDGAVDEADLDAMFDVLDGVWTAPRALKGLVLRGVRAGPDEQSRDMSHAEILALSDRDRTRMAAVSRWRVHGFDQIHPAPARVVANPRLCQVASLVLGQPAHPAFSLNFVVGSEQALHQDMATNHVWPRNHMVLAWVACEDVGPGSGPLTLWPGSHREPLFAGFVDYPQTNLRTGDSRLAEQYQHSVDAAAQRYERREFLAKKGQVLFFHSMLIHGGAPATDAAATRKSMVIDYFTRGANRSLEVHGPFRW